MSQITEEIKYCTSCGAVNKKSATVCVECGEKTQKRHYSFIDYLKAHIKDEFQGRVTGSILSLLKNYLRSHLYGVILSVSVVCTGAVFATTTAPEMTIVSQSPIETALPAVSEKTVAEEKTAEEVKEEETQEIDPAQLEEMLGESDYLYTSYENEAERIYWGDAFDPQYSSPYSELVADDAIADFPYTCVHDIKTHGTYYAIESDDNVTHSYSFGADNMILDGEKVTSDLAKQLYADGYEVAERMHYVYGYYEKKDWSIDEIDPNSSTYEPDRKMIYNIVYVKIGDRWYIAEDRLVGRK